MNAPVPGGVRANHLRSIALIPSGDWRASHLFTSREYLSTIEEAFREQVRFDYVLWRTQAGVAGGAVFQTFDLRVPEHLPLLAPGFTGSASLSPVFRPLIAGLLSRLRLRVVLCGNFFACGPRGTWCTPGASSASFDRWLAATARQLTQDVAERGVRVLLILKDHGGSPWAAPDASFEAIGGDPAMALELSAGWRTLDDYASSLRSSYRREFRRVRDRGADVERRELSAQDIRAGEARIDELHAQVLARARVVPARKNARLFARLKDALGPRFSFVGYFERTRLVAFNTRFLCGEDFESHYFGVDRAVSEARCLYKNLLYDDVADALAHRCRRVLFGRDAQEVKSSLGARPLPWTSFLRHESRAATALLAATARRFGPVSWSPRHPFRESAGTTRG